MFWPAFGWHGAELGCFCLAFGWRVAAPDTIWLAPQRMGGTGLFWLVLGW